MARLILLDAGPLGLACRRPGIARADHCRAWLLTLEAARATVVVPEIADYEVRRELSRLGANQSLLRLDALATRFQYAELTTAVMRQAAEFWALARRGGFPTADPQALDGDAILAAQAALIGGPGDSVTVATSNARHLARFPGVSAQDWTAIV